MPLRIESHRSSWHFYLGWGGFGYTTRHCGIANGRLTTVLKTLTASTIKWRNNHKRHSFSKDTEVQGQIWKLQKDIRCHCYMENLQLTGKFLSKLRCQRTQCWLVPSTTKMVHCGHCQTLDIPKHSLAPWLSLHILSLSWLFWGQMIQLIWLD